MRDSAPMFRNAVGLPFHSEGSVYWWSQSDESLAHIGYLDWGGTDWQATLVNGQVLGVAATANDALALFSNEPIDL